MSKEGPKEETDVAVRRQGKNLHVRILSEEKIAQRGSSLGFVQSNDQEVRFLFVDNASDILVVLHFTDNFNIRLIGDGWREPALSSGEAGSPLRRARVAPHSAPLRASMVRRAEKKRFKEEVSKKRRNYLIQYQISRFGEDYEGYQASTKGVLNLWRGHSGFSL